MTGADEPRPRRQLALFDATMLVVGVMIGSGIFVVSADMARDLGGSGWLLSVWALTGVMTLIGALSYAELAAMMPEAGGLYVYLREAYGPLAGFLYGWTAFLVMQTGLIAAVSVAFAKYLGVFFPGLGTDAVLGTLALPTGVLTVSAGQFVAAGVVIVLTGVNCRGLREGAFVQNLFTVAKTAALIGLIVVGLVFARSPEVIARNLADPWGGIYQADSVARLGPTLGGVVPPVVVALMAAGGAMVGGLFSADAWYNVTFTAGETKDPQRTVPLSLALGTAIVILLYLLANLGYLAALPLDGRADGATPLERGIAHAKDDRIGTAVLELVAPRLGVWVMAGAIMVSTFGCVNGIVLAGGRLFQAMARDGLFFRGVARLNPRGVPAVALALQGAWAAVLIFSGSYSQLLDYVIFAALLFYALTVGAVFVFRRSRPAAPRPYRAVGYPVLQILYIGLCAAIMLDLLWVKPLFTWPGLLIVLSGVPVYFARSRRPTGAAPAAESP